MFRLSEQSIKRARVIFWALFALALTCTSPACALTAMPVLGLVGLLLADRFPGEELLERARTRRQPAPRPRHTKPLPRPRTSFVPSVGISATFALAMRPPPAAVAVAGI